MLESLIQKLSKFDKVLVIGPQRSGTTISALIIANELGYKFIDESQYGYCDKFKFLYAFSGDKIVVHNTTFFKKIYMLSTFFKEHNIAMVLIKRNINDIVKSFENSKKFTIGPFMDSTNLFSFCDEVMGGLNEHYDHDGKRPLAEVQYEHFYEHNKDFFVLNYEDLSEHHLFIKKDERRKTFKHLKQVDKDPYFLNKLYA